jgi:hypothetical protein
MKNSDESLEIVLKDAKMRRPETGWESEED